MRRLAIRALRRFGLLDGFFVARRRLRSNRRRLSSKWALRRLSAHVGDLPPGFGFVRVGSSCLVARTVERMRTHEIRDENFTHVVDACEVAGLDFFVVATGSVFRTAIGVPVRQKRRTIDALRSASDEPDRYVVPTGQRSDGRPLVHAERRWDERAMAATSLEVYSVLASPAGSGVVGREHRCTVQFWEPANPPSPDGVPTEEDLPVPVDSPWIGCVGSNPYADVIPVGRAFEDEATVAGRSCPTAPEFRWYLRGSRCPFPIDVVYTWVDGDDTGWAQRRRRAGGGDGASRDGVTTERFRTFDELRYSLRSLHQYVPDVRNVYVVTDRQVPSWLDRSDTRITIVDHTEIFSDLSALPTFNSHAIESQLHHIDGLAEHYLYVNDDVFFGRLFNWETYFERSGRSRFFPSKARFAFGDPSTRETSVDNAGKNLQRSLFAVMGAAPATKIKHTPHPQQRSLMEEIEEVFADSFKETMHARFRSPSDVSFAAALHHRYGEAVGRASAGSTSYQYLNLATPNLIDHLADLSEMSFDTLCLNDGAIEPDRHRGVKESVERFLRRRFPYPAPWELDEA